MPVYVYECEECGEFELEQSMKDDALEKCPECGSSVSRIPQPPMVIRIFPDTKTIRGRDAGGKEFEVEKKLGRGEKW